MSTDSLDGARSGGEGANSTDEPAGAAPHPPADVTPSATQDEPTRGTTRPRRTWLRWLIGGLATVLAVAGAIVLVSLVGSRGGAGDPRNLGRTGTAAMASLVESEGIEVTVSTDTHAPQATSTTTLVLSGRGLTQDQFQAALSANPSSVVLVGFDAVTLTRVGLPVSSTSAKGSALREPTCDQGDARATGTIVLDGSVGYDPTGHDDRLKRTCYPVGDGEGYGLLEYELRGITVLVVAGGLSNGEIGTDNGEVQGNAALGMHLLGHQPRLTWWVVPLTQAPSDPTTPTGPSLVPSRFVMALVASIPVLVVVAIWRGRRLGPLMTERLPVVVPASETVEGHGRLYHRINATTTAAGHLRAGTLRRLARRWGTSDPDRLVEIVSDLSALSPEAVSAALTGPLPTTETDLWRLKHTLASIEQEARP